MSLLHLLRAHLSRLAKHRSTGPKKPVAQDIEVSDDAIDILSLGCVDAP